MNSQRQAHLARGFLVMAILLGVVLAFAALPARAADIPSSISGRYNGSGDTAGWQCRVWAAQIADADGGSNRVLYVDCETPGSQRRSGAMSTTLECVTEAVKPPLVPWGVACSYPIPGSNVLSCVGPPTPRWSIISSSPSTAACPLGELRVSIVPFVSSASSLSTFCRDQVLAPTSMPTSTPPSFQVNSYPGCSSPTVTSAATPNKPGKR